MQRLTVFLIFTLWAAGELSAQSDGAAKNRQATALQATASATNSGDPRRMPPGLTPEREAAAMTFVRQHHAALVDLLVYLKEQQPDAYEQAVLDLFRASEKLAQQQEQNYERYEFELALWKIESRIELLAARLKMAGRDSPEGEALLPQLKKLLDERHDLRARRLAFERQKILERAERMERQLETMQAHREQTIARELNGLVGQPRPAAQPRPAQRNKPNATTGNE